MSAAAWVDASDADDEAAAAVLCRRPWLMPPRLLWSLRTPALLSPQMLRMKLPTKFPLKTGLAPVFFN